MQRFLIALISLGIAASVLTAVTSCKHEPLLSDDNMPVTGKPCSPDSVYFEKDVLPILISNCALSGCHNASSAKDGVILNNYSNVVKTGEVKAFRPDDSELYEVITEDNPEKRMPPNGPPLPQNQIAMIEKWIMQGAKNLKCDPDAAGCDLTNVTYSQTISPVINDYCKGCHSGGSPSGGIDLSTYQGVKAIALNGKFFGAVSWSAGFSSMPQGGSKLPDRTLARIKTWIDAGAPEN